jgi:hypothetical protein
MEMDGVLRRGICRRIVREIRRQLVPKLKTKRTVIASAEHKKGFNKGVAQSGI